MIAKFPRDAAYSSRLSPQLFCLRAPESVYAALTVAGLLSPFFAVQALSQEIIPLSDARWESMIGKSWHPGQGCPARSDLKELRVTFKSLSDGLRVGSLIVERQSTSALARTFRKLLDCNFRIHRIDPVDEFDGDDEKSMAANNTSAFNCRRVDGSTRLSAHAVGAAIDINTVQNPQVRNGVLLRRQALLTTAPKRETKPQLLAASCQKAALSGLSPPLAESGAGVEKLKGLSALF